MRIFILILFLAFTTLANADLVVSGKRVIFTGDALQSGKTITESEVAPTTPALNDIWRCITDGTIYTWNGSVWEVSNKTQDIKNEIAIFRANIVNVSDPAVKKCLVSLGKILLKLYKE